MPGAIGGAMSGEVVLDCTRKQVEKVWRSKPLISIPPSSLLEFWPAGACPDLLQ